MNKIYNTQEKKNRLIIFLLVFLNVLIHMLVYNNLGYHRDEMLYLSFGYHPAAGYASVPPLMGWIAWIINHTFGYSLFIVRLIPAILSGMLVFLVTLIVKELGGKIFAQILAAIALIVSPISLRTFLFFMPVPIELVFWTLIFYLVIKYVNTKNDNLLIYIGIIAGLSLMNKYLIALLFVAILLNILFTPYRNVFKNRKLYIGIILGFLIFLPNIIWQITHDIPAINHLAELKTSQLVHVSRVNFLIEQLLNPGAATILTVPGLIWLMFSKSQNRFRFLGFTIIFIVAVLCILRGKSYYAQGIIPVSIAVGAVFYERIINRNSWRIILPSYLILSSLPSLPLGLPVSKSPGLVQYFKFLKDNNINIGTRFEDETIHSLPQDYADMIGWEELASITNNAYQQIKNKNEALIYCDNYGQASAINIIGKKYGLPSPVSLNESYVYWLPVTFNSEITSLIYINSYLDYNLKQLFDSIKVVGKISSPDAREYGTTVFLCENPKSSFNSSFKRIIAERTFFERKKIIAQLNQTRNIAKNKKSWASSVEGSSNLSSNAFDGAYKTRWSSKFNDPQWIIVDLGKNYKINEVILFWESAYAKSYQVQVSTDMQKWNTVFETCSGKGGIDSILIKNVNTRYVKMLGSRRATNYGYSLWEFYVRGVPEAQ